MKKLFALMLCLIILFSLTSCGVDSFEKGKQDRQEVVDLIIDGDVEIAENGLVTLPDDLKNISDTGECCIVEFRGHTALYFFTYRGILGESRGYVYVSDRIDWKDFINEDEYVASPDWVDVEELENNWYSVKTN